MSVRLAHTGACGVLPEQDRKMITVDRDSSSTKQQAANTVHRRDQWWRPPTCMWKVDLESGRALLRPHALGKGVSFSASWINTQKCLSRACAITPCMTEGYKMSRIASRFPNST